HRRGPWHFQEKDLRPLLQRCGPSGDRVRYPPSAKTSSGRRRRKLPGRRGGKRLPQSADPRWRLAERHGKDCTVAVNHVQSEQKRNVQARLLNGVMLELVRGLNALQIKKRAHLTLGGHFRVAAPARSRARR